MELPQTLRDAVRITRRLGLQYLWIDALLILKDPTRLPEKTGSSNPQGWEVYIAMRMLP